MTQKSIPWWEPKLGEPVREAVSRVLDANYINDGPTTRAMEARLAEIAGVAHCAATPSCTAALAISLMAVGIGPGDEVIVPDVTFIATANAVKLAGGEVRLVDVERQRLTIDPEKAKTAIGPRTKAIIAVDFNGRGAEYPALEAICEEHGLALICDSAGALGSRYRGRALGSHGIAGCYSFSGNKMFFGGQGGAVVTDDDAIFARLKDLRDHGRRESRPRNDVLHPVVGFNFKYPSLMAAVILAQLDELDERLDHARTRDAWYRKLLSDCPGISFPGEPVGEEETCLWADIYVDDRVRLMDALEEAEIGFRPLFLPLHRQEPYRQPDDAFPNAVESWKKGLWLPSALSLTRNQAERVASICRKTLS